MTRVFGRSSCGDSRDSYQTRLFHWNIPDEAHLVATPWRSSPFESRPFAPASPGAPPLWPALARQRRVCASRPMGHRSCSALSPEGRGRSAVEDNFLAADTAGWLSGLGVFQPGSSSHFSRLKLQDRRPVQVGSTKSNSNARLITGAPNVSKGIVTTTSRFAPPSQLMNTLPLSSPSVLS
jgi:hypothetical protein